MLRFTFPLHSGTELLKRRPSTRDAPRHNSALLPCTQLQTHISNGIVPSVYGAAAERQSYITSSQHLSKRRVGDFTLIMVGK